MRPVKWGIVSTAHINRLVIPPAQDSEKCDLIAVASRDAARSDVYAREWGIERSYGSYEALLDDPDVEAVYISLPNSLHCEWSIRAVEAGKHVLCEKPLSRRAAEVEAAFDAADRAGRLLSEAFMWRHNPQTAKLTELVGEGAVGTPRVIRSSFSFTIADDPNNVRLLSELDGGALMDVGCYCVNASRLLGGDPLHTAGVQVLGGDGVDVLFSGAMLHKDGLMSHFDCGFLLPERDELEVIGEEGSLFLDDPWHVYEPLIEIRRDGAVERVEIERANNYQLELENLSEAIRSEAEPLLGRGDAVGNARVLEALYDSAETR
jgi:D-xylose 1-dehydrogenase (NADP+, D-xylono-1,5-lactone-forming)